MRDHPERFDHVVPCDAPGCVGGYVGLQMCNKCLGAGKIWISVQDDLRRARIWNWTLGILCGLTVVMILWLIARGCQ